jgi:serine/threonine protein kinase/tetratricopeptide (TPR) repeat protein
MPSVEPGRTVGGRFVVEHKAATGGMGVVYRARDERDGTAIALKVLSRNWEWDERRFVREAELLAELRHPGIVRHVAHGHEKSREESYAWLAMEWLDGEDLAQRIGRVGLTVDESVRIVARIAEALGSAHALGVVHRDIKPSNVFLVGTDVDRPRLLDFGIARLGDVSAALTQSGVMLGTPGYIAPEQARGALPDPRGDVFSLGCVLFECLTGRPVFSGDHPMALLAKIVLADIPRVRDLRPEIPEALDALVSRMLEKDPAARPRDGSAVAAALSSHEPYGGSVAPPRATRSILTASERRLVAAVFARTTHELANDATMITGSSRPPRVGPSFTALRAEVEQHGGRLEVLPRGALVVAMHGIGPATDLAARAARCALRMRMHLPDAAIALATGRGEVHTRTTAAEPIERAAQLLGDPLADARGCERGVRIDDVTAGLLDGRFEISGDERGLLLRGERDAIDTGRTLLGRKTPCVGRERELGMLGAIWEDCIDGPSARVALITAGPGVGKSRLRHELLRRLSPAEVWLSRGDAIRAGSPYTLIGDALRRAAGVHDDEPQSVRERKLRARVGRHVAAEHVARVASFLGEISGTPFPDDAHPQLRVARRDPTVMSEAARDAFVEFVAAECSAHPLMIVLEDLHWGDLPTVRLIDAALRELHDRPLLIFALARAEVHEVFPRIFASRPLDELRLGEIPKRAAADLARSVLGPNARDEVVARIVAQASGNAFFLEELIRAVAEGHSRGELPETVIAMVQARLEALEPDARRILRAASVLGETFWEGCVTALIGGEDRSAEVTNWLRELESRELVARRPASRFGNESEWAFRHAIVRDAAHAMLTPHDAALGHRIAAEWLEREGERDAMVLAEHYERGGSPERALPWWRRASKQAFDGNDLSGAIARAERGLGCGATGDARAGLLLVQSEAHSWRDDVVSAERCAMDAMDAVAPGTPLWWRAAGDAVTFGGLAYGHERVMRVAPMIEAAPWATQGSPVQVFGGAFATIILFDVGEVDRAAHLVARLDALPDERRPPAIEGWIELARYMRARFRDRDPGAMLAHGRSAAALFDRAGDRRTRMWGTIGLGWALDAIGRLPDAEEVLRSAHAEAERIGLPWAISWSGIYLARVIARRGHVDEARRLLDAARERVEAGGNRLYSALAQMERARIELREGALADAEGYARRSCELLEGYDGYRAHAIATLARVLAARGETEEAARVAAAPIADGVLDEADVALRVARLELAPDRAAARALVDELRARAATLTEDLRDAFLSGVEDHARAVQLANA